jgi:hypothetical protein
VRSQANGSHYTSADALPLIPRIDGVGQREDGSRVYFVLPALAQAIGDGTLCIDAFARPLAEVEAIWNAPISSSQRVVLVP